jgi:hypothetical protein
MDRGYARVGLVQMLNAAKQPLYNKKSEECDG